jgi:tRNA (guanosine-2'-O-)-methyltransferase
MNDPKAANPTESRRLARAEAILAARTRALTVVLEDAHDPHNVSAVLRTCDALGIQDVHLVTEHESETVLNPRVSIGAERWLTLHRHRGATAAIAALRGAGYRLFVSHVAEEAPALAALPAVDRAAYVFGNERAGVSNAWLAAADSTFIIPTFGFSGSLNLSVAVALTLYDRLAARPQAHAGDLSPAERDVLRAEWYAALAGANAERRREYSARAASNPVSPGSIYAVDRRTGATHRAP